MKFSIIIPAHNAEKRIWRLLESIRRQDYTDYETIVVCDDCSDKTALIAGNYGCEVYEIGAHNAGVARSEGLDRAKGEWVLFADDDDWWINDYALSQINGEIGFLDKTPDVLQCPFVFGYKGVTIGTRIWPNVWSKVWRREFIGETRFPNVYPDDDLKFVQTVLDKKPKVAYMPILWYYYNYMRPGSITFSLEAGK